MSQGSAKKHICVLCNTELKSKEDLQLHFRKHANKEIDSKGRAWKASNGGKIPEKDFEPSRAGIICDICNEEFETNTIAIQHKFRKHPESAAKHFCPYCGMQFPLKVNRDKHMSEHKPASPTDMFPCSDCGVIFYNQEAQTYHTKSTHKRIVALYKPVATAPPTKKIRLNNAGDAQSVYYCHICGFEYIVKFNLQKHLERQHTEKERNSVPEDLIKCTTCDALFYNTRAYENHNMYHKPDDLYVVSEAQRLQTVTRVDQDFDIRRVQTAAEKFIPLLKPQRPKRQVHKKKKKSQVTTDDLDELSPPDSSDSAGGTSDSDDASSNSDSCIPLVTRLRAVRRVK